MMKFKRRKFDVVAFLAKQIYNLNYPYIIDVRAFRLIDLSAYRR